MGPAGPPLEASREEVEITRSRRSQFQVVINLLAFPSNTLLHPHWIARSTRLLDTSDTLDTRSGNSSINPL